jgi:hypothetical protein
MLMSRYNGDRSHGLIMGCAVVGTKPVGWTPPKPRSITPSSSSSDKADGSSDIKSVVKAVLSAVFVLPRFALGAAGAM